MLCSLKRIDEYEKAVAAKRPLSAFEVQVLHLVVYTVWVHVRLVTIHPFIDGNGRLARLLMNLVLLQHEYIVTIIPPILRHEYIRLVRAGNFGKLEPFYEFIAQCVLESYKENVRLLGLTLAQKRLMLV